VVEARSETRNAQAPTCAFRRPNDCYRDYQRAVGSATRRSESMLAIKTPRHEPIVKAISFTIVEYPEWVDARLEEP